MTSARIVGLVFGLLSGVVWPAAATDAAMMPAPPPKILAPLDGATVSRHVVVRFEGAGEAAAHAAAMSGGAMTQPGHRHLHLLIDADVPKPGASVPMDARHRHFMGGETSASLDLAPGRHTLRLLIANGQHVVDDPPVVSPPVTVTVK